MRGLMDFIKTVDALKKILKEMKNQLPLNDEQRAEIAFKIAQVLHENKIDLKTFLATDRNNRKILEHAFVFMAVYGKDKELSPKMIMNFLTDLFTPASKLTPRPELKLNKEELVAVLLLKLKKRDPDFKPADAKEIASEIKENNELDEALADLTNINILGYDPKGVRTTLSPAAGKTNTSGLALLCHLSSFHDVLESALLENPIFFELEDERHETAGEEQSFTARARIANKAQEDQDFFEKKNPENSNDHHIESPFDALLRRAKQPPRPEDDL